VAPAFLSVHSPSNVLDTAKRPGQRRATMSADPAALDHVFTSQGGFTLAYKRLVVLARSMLDTYGGDSAARVVLRQLDPEEVVNVAFERIFAEAAEIGPETYNSLRSHIRNHVHSLAKSAQQARTVRVDESEKSTALYQQQTDPTETSAVDRVLIADDFEFCVKVMARLELEGRDDPEVGLICRAVAAGHRDYADLCRHAQLTPPAFDAGLKRLKRKFLHLVRTVEADLTPTPARSAPAAPRPSRTPDRPSARNSP